MFTIEYLRDGSLTSVPGFRAAGVACGLKKTGAPDLALVVAEKPCTAAALFTTNRVQAAPVIYDREVLSANPTGLRGVVINSGCANACTGEQGLADARATADLAAQLLGGAGGDYMVMSTGVIGQHLSMAKIGAGVAAAVREASADVDAGHAAARAIMTTDTRPKEIAVRVPWQGGVLTVAGMAKGSGMIHINMATMLCTLVTDAAVAPTLAQRALRWAIQRTLNMVTVDGDTSTNDTALLLANGLADVPPIASEGPAYRALCMGLEEVTHYLAREIARDGEGAKHLIEITVSGAASRTQAKQVAMAIARSPLVKTAIYGQDANWGRIVCAAGYSGAPVEPERMRVWLGGLELFRYGAPYDVDEERAAQILAKDEVEISLDLGLGHGRATVWTCDLTHRYVDINAHYRT